MFYDFKCPKCGEIDTVEASIKEGPPQEVICKKCNSPMERVWMDPNAASINIPDSFRAVPVGGGDSVSEAYFDNIKNNFKHNHPSGKYGKQFY